MLHKTSGIVLRSVKYGESSLVVTIFTAHFGTETYIVQGVRSPVAGKNRTSLFQPATLLDLVLYRQPQKNMQRIREYNRAHIYTSIQEDVIKNTIVLFSIELLLRLLPEHAPSQSLFDFAFAYFITLDNTKPGYIANFPLFFIINCTRIMGYELKGAYSNETPHLSMHDGAFTSDHNVATSLISDSDTKILNELITIPDYGSLARVKMNAQVRLRLIDWFITFLQEHTQHMGNIRSLAVLKSILH